MALKDLLRIYFWSLRLLKIIFTGLQAKLCIGVFFSFFGFWDSHSLRHPLGLVLELS